MEREPLAELARVSYVGVRCGTPLDDEAVEEWIDEHRARPEVAVQDGPVIVP